MILAAKFIHSLFPNSEIKIMLIQNTGNYVRGRRIGTGTEKNLRRLLRTINTWYTKIQDIQKDKEKNLAKQLQFTPKI